MILASLEVEKKTGASESRAMMDRLSERLCSIETWMRQQGPIMTEKVETIVSQKAVHAMTNPAVQSLVPMDVGRTGAPDAQTLQFRGFVEIVKPVSGIRASGHTT